MGNIKHSVYKWTKFNKNIIPTKQHTVENKSTLDFDFLYAYTHENTLWGDVVSKKKYKIKISFKIECLVFATVADI
jgi:hypothetical protein